MICYCLLFDYIINIYIEIYYIMRPSFAQITKDSARIAKRPNAVI